MLFRSFNWPDMDLFVMILRLVMNIYCPLLLTCGCWGERGTEEWGTEGGRGAEMGTSKPFKGPTNPIHWQGVAL